MFTRKFTYIVVCSVWEVFKLINRVFIILNMLVCECGVLLTSFVGEIFEYLYRTTQLCIQNTILILYMTHYVGFLSVLTMHTNVCKFTVYSKISNYILQVKKGENKC